MSKIICDVCGTTYPETATQCPICGCVRPADADTVGDGEAKTYTHVKGGRFSKANVRKRIRANGGTVQDIYDDPYEDEENQAEEIQPERKSEIGLVITAAILLLAIVAVVIYIALRFFGPQLPEGTDAPGTTNTTANTITTDLQIKCTAVNLDVLNIDLDEIGSARMLYVSVEPIDATDELIFTSSDDTVVTVTQSGKVTAVGPGEAVITVTCGEISKSCTVTCMAQGGADDPTDDTTESTEETTLPVEDDFHLNRKDITFDKKGASWIIYDGSLPLNLISWTSDNEKVATIENATVTAVGAGQTEVHAEYNGVKVSCIIRCDFSESSENQGVGGNGGVGEDGAGAVTGPCKIYSQYGVLSYGGVAEASIRTGEVLYLSLRDSNGNTVSANCTVSGSACSLSDGAITGVSAGTTTVTFTYNGESYSCKIIVY